MFKQLIAISLLLAFASQTFNKAFIVVNYFSNTSSYAKNCENKAKPILHCNGKCQMMKKLKKEENKDAQNPERKLESKNEILFLSKSIYIGISFSLSQATISNYITLPTGEETKMPRSIFHPPSA